MPHSGATPAVRCDSALAGRPAGCVIPQAIPEMLYELDGPYPELALHIQEAQASGLPAALRTDRFIASPIRYYSRRIVTPPARAACRRTLAKAATSTRSRRRGRVLPPEAASTASR